MEDKVRAPRNRTITLSTCELESFRNRLVHVDSRLEQGSLIGRTINGDVLTILPYLPNAFVDLMVVDPPYNLNKKFNSNSFKKTDIDSYADWLSDIFSKLKKLLKPTASLYVCSDWSSSVAVYAVISKLFVVRNRITWEREKGRGATHNWKNASEDIWFCTVGDDYVFNVDAVKLKRRVIAPYTNNSGEPKDWTKSTEGNFRLTHPSNLWTDITIPFWSMPENTDHPTQKPEKLIAKLVLASSNPGDLVFDPFLGSGTTSVVAKKLDRRFVGVELDETFACLAEKRLLLAETDKTIQGYSDGVFWERNTMNEQIRFAETGAENKLKTNGRAEESPRQSNLFD